MTNRDEKRRALRHAIEAMENLQPYAFGYMVKSDIAHLRELLIDIEQLPLPLEKKPRKAKVME